MAGRKKSARTAGRRNKSNSSPLAWFVGGIVIGLGGAVFLFTQGFLPSMPDRLEAEPRPAVTDNEELLGDEAVQEREDQRYDFFTVLPEMEVVVPDRELAESAQPEAQQPTTTNASAEQFILQAGSFRNAADAEQMKARLALLGSSANVQTVTVNNQTWHRVRVGPVNGAPEADQLRRQLQSNGIDVLVLKISS